MRLTFNALQDGLAAINTAAQQLQDAQWQVSTGRRLHFPSDDPVSAQTAVTAQGDIAGLDSYTSTGSTANSRLTALDSTLGDIVTKLTQALSTATGAHGNTPDQVSRDAASQSLIGVREAIATDINSKFDGSYLFSGTNSSTQPYVQVAGAWTYQGNNTPAQVEVLQGRSVAFTVDGQQVMQGSDSTDLLTTLDNLAAAVKTGDNTAIGNGIDALQRAMTRTTSAQSMVGVDENTLSDAQTRIATLRQAASDQLSKASDANLADAITRMVQADTTYKAALGAVGATEKVSLLDYLS